ncbi:SPOC domain-containing protein [Microdochium trichocladiopsis]|uniref:Transcription factor BYE1 n=1 Tax=Microdochium trichocladiopsis TaxID=1682393 RepID=A0A9P8Y317_9PEZI|nr:SPOC domain-containing protein [Microdochium trichocladiopsis]KAH7027978.1 SPOC domain-containing protein [Microdochium trichocladiopsis]
MSDPEPRRSFRATKGQHTKAFEELGNGPDMKNKRQSKKGGKKSSQKEEAQDEDEEVIRCICGATTQEDDDANEPWIACDKCGAWQHNVCVGMSVFTEDLTKDYFCEQCAPDDHKETLEAIAKGEKPWVERRQKYEDDKKKKKGKKGKGKRISDTQGKEKDRLSPDNASSTNKNKLSPTPDIKKEDISQDALAASSKGKRKSRDHSQGPQSKIQKTTETPAAPTPTYPAYTPPDDLPATIAELEAVRQQKAKALLKSLDVAIEQAERKGLYAVPADTTKKAVTERLAIEIERAFHDAHGTNSGAAAQLRTLVFNLKGNVDLSAQLFNRTLPPPSFVIMTGEELANKELQKENAELKARAEKQSILIQQDGPRMRRTHKGDEVVEGDAYTAVTEEAPSALRRADAMDVDTDEAAPKEKSAAAGAPLRVDTKAAAGSNKQQNFDIGKVFNSVRSPSATHQRRQSAQVPSAGPGEDADVDRLLKDGTESPPYSPTQNVVDPDVIWSGPLVMTNIADVSVSAKHVGGADLKKAKNIEWTELIPAVLTVAGRIPEDKAVPYLCAMRYNNQIDLIFTSLSPSNAGDEIAKKQFTDVIKYFQSKKRYGVVGDKKLGNVRDTYLIPISEGDGPLPEPLQNIDDHKIPVKRSEPMLLMVFVFRDEKQAQIPLEQQKLELQGASPTTSDQSTPVPHRHSVATPGYSPATPHAPQAPGGGIHPTPPPQYSQTPVPPPSIPGQPSQHAPPRPPQPHPSQATAPHDPNAAAMRAAQAEGERKARQVLGPLFASATVTFLLPHAARMKEGEWNAVKRCLERDPRARDDLPLLSKLLTEEGNNARQAGQQQQQQQQQGAAPGGVQKTMAAAGRQPSPAGPRPTPQQHQQAHAMQGKQQQHPHQPVLPQTQQQQQSQQTQQSATGMTSGPAAAAAARAPQSQPAAVPASAPAPSPLTQSQPQQQQQQAAAQKQ